MNYKGSEDFDIWGKGTKMGNMMFGKRENVIPIQERDKDSITPCPNNPRQGT